MLLSSCFSLLLMKLIKIVSLILKHISQQKLVCILININCFAVNFWFTRIHILVELLFVTHMKTVTM